MSESTNNGIPWSDIISVIGMGLIMFMLGFFIDSCESSQKDKDSVCVSMCDADFAWWDSSAEGGRGNARNGKAGGACVCVDRSKPPVLKAESEDEQDTGDGDDE